ncbi:hypothetical protein H7J76_30495 [Mycolicibacterium fortuitum]|uniref:hypothetical protein n=1 Tax=Mycolicibacterium fortuitum TaxID=1766 RepID=UPI0007EA1EE4|nr:hypothetical protein [Mycolicibacterium fortuitum]MCV7143473.1 hypothetical protein [Mycolicibacterium fortuitum]
MRWFARPEDDPLELRFAPRLASWNKVDDPDQVRLRAYLDDTEALVATSRIDGPWALRLDVGLPSSRDLLEAGDLDNYAYPLAYRLRDPNLVSVWCTKQHSEQSTVRIGAAREAPAPVAGMLVARTTASASSVAYKDEIHAAATASAELPPGPVRLELSFVLGPHRNWLNLWKQTIDALDPLLGRTRPDRAWHPLDGRITELGMHRTVDPAAGNAVLVAIYASPGQLAVDSTNAFDALQPAADEIPHVEPLDAAGDQHPRAREFRDDDAGYLAWLAAHSHGYVVNIARNHGVSAARLHRAHCRTISGQNPHNGAWTGPYVKVCAEQLTAVETWASDTVRSAIPTCGICKPDTMKQ